MKKLFSVFTILYVVILLSGNSFAQQWSAEQKEVWTVVEKYWENTPNDPLSFLQYFDDSYLDWSYDSETPTTKNDAVKFFSYWTKKAKEQYHILTPARIWVNGDFAFVHYYYTQVFETTEGKPLTQRGRWTDILMKKSGKWMLVGDHGGEIKHND